MAQVQKMPIFARGSEEAMRAALAPGGQYENLDRILWCYIKDGARKGQLAFVTPGAKPGDDEIIEFMVGDNESSVQVLDALPEIENAKTNVLYLVGDVGFIFDGESFVRVFDMSAVSDLETAISTINSEISTINQTLDDRQADFTNFSEALDVWKAAAEQDIINLTGAVTQVQTDMSGLAERVTQTESSVTALESQSDDLEQRILNNASGIDALTTRVGTLETDVNTVKEDISDLEARVVATEADITDLQNQDTALAQSINGIRTDLTALQNRVTTIESDISSLQNTLENDYMDTPTTTDAINQAVSDAMELVEF